jgi:formimidoylglutamate deiminase
LTVVVPDLVLDGRGVRRDVAIEIADGTIVAVGPAEAVGPDAERLRDVGLVPGFVNAHSHAFQRDLRGRAERRSSAEDDFWSWRTQMYAAAATLDPESIHDVARRCYRQMRHAGYTAVGEFHYVHHRPDGTPYERPNELAEAVCAAAEAEGIRICLLLAAYERGGAGGPPSREQRRFCDRTVDAFLERAEELAAWAAARPRTTVGLGPHSVRAVSSGWLSAIAAYARHRDMPLHVHADEQAREIEECLAEHGMRPIELLAECGVLGNRTTVIHATHADERELELLRTSGATVCLCPTTEGNLGDGWPPAAQLVTAGISLAVGSDSNVRLDPFEELREVELCARRIARRRGVLFADAPSLLEIGWEGGAGALGLPSPAIDEGAPADLIEIDLLSDALAGVADDDLAAALVFSGDASVVRSMWSTA